MSTDAADLFCQIYDSFSADQLDPHEVNSWLTDEQVHEIASYTEAQVVEQGTLDEEEVWTSIEMAEAADRRRFSYLLGIDNALLYANPQTATHDVAGLGAIATRYVTSGRLNTAMVDGALLPRFTAPMHDVASESLSEAFIAVVRVCAKAWNETDHVVIPKLSDFTRRDRERGIVFGCVPFLESLDELDWQRKLAPGVPSFRATVVASEDLRKRISVVLKRLDEQGAMVGIVPELCASERMLAWWQEEIARQPAPRDSVLRWIFIGTGPVDSIDPPKNTGILIDRRSGAILLSQDKIHPFNLREDHIRDWNLVDQVGEGGVREDITKGKKVTVAECALGRLIILICEDLAQTMTIGPSMLKHGVSHALCPVFCDELEPHHWEHSKAKQYADQIGTQVVVANSRAIARNQGHMKIGTALGHSPRGWEIGTTVAPDEIVLLRLSEEAAVRAVGRRTTGLEGFEGSASALE